MNFENTLGLNYEKKLLKTIFTEKPQEKITKFLNISKTYKSKKNSLQPKGYPDARKTIGKS